MFLYPKVLSCIPKPQKGLNKVVYNTAKLEKGLYWVRLTYAGKKMVKKFLAGGR